MDYDHHFRYEDFKRYGLPGALAISLAVFTMVVTRSEHPPAAALALGLVLNDWISPRWRSC